MLLAFAGVFLNATAANADDAGGSVTNLSFDKAIAGSGEAVKLNFSWSVPDNSRAGDTFTIVLPNQLVPKSTAAVNLRSTAPGGETVATGSWSGKTVTFSLTSYVTANPLGVRGDGFFAVMWDSNVVSGETGQNHQLTFGGSANQTLPLEFRPDGPAGTEQDWGKTGYWADSNQGSVSLKGQLGWALWVKTQTTYGTDSLVITDAPGAGWAIDISTVEGFVRTPAGDEPLASSRYQVEQAGNGMTITVVGNYPGEPAVYQGESLYFLYNGDLLPGNDGVFYNSTTFAADGDETNRDAIVLTDEAGGTGIGGRSVTVGDFVWIDTNSNGIQDAGEPGIENVELAIVGPNGAVTDVDGNDVANVKTKASGEYIFTGLPALERGQHYTVSIVQDSASTIAALTGYSPTLSGSGDDTALDSSTWTAESGDLPLNGMRDMTLDFGFVLNAVPPTAVAPVVPTVVQSVCAADGTASVPTVTVAETAGVSYEISGDVAAGNTVTVTATVGEGFFLTAAEGWVLDGNTATFSIELVEVECDQPVAPVVPTVEKPKVGLASTGVDPFGLGAVSLLLLLAGIVLQVRRKIGVQS